MTEPLFDELRTKKQLGYSVSCYYRVIHGVGHFGVELLSSQYQCDEIAFYVLEFLCQYFYKEHLQVRLQQNDFKKFKKYVKSQTVSVMAPDINLRGRFDRFWTTMVQDNWFLFDRKKIIQKYLQHVKLVDVIDFFEKYILLLKPNPPTIAAGDGGAPTFVRNDNVRCVILAIHAQKFKKTTADAVSTDNDADDEKKQQSQSSQPSEQSQQQHNNNRLKTLTSKIWRNDSPKALEETKTKFGIFTISTVSKSLNK
ncbi:hypothetical protein RFI_19464 [Reticulomyxa filosa]|uniref:Coenzyme PQQ synthesis protein F-like C-terminal lobe domain-containing protein n=1 Tax=Reticulomyxa filosa TaxID=46433 RepID=X6MW41_RETFI|nr:hypothetical protein RFI_19464 [Reticulomyxa filosa]|eukprot:ETO17846.1 hypothetical protein RFI_19464 [Reticulomyxa filosa]